MLWSKLNFKVSILLPKLETIIYGKSNIENVDLLFQGGILFVAVKGSVRIYYKQQQYVRQAQRIVKNYGEEWTCWLADVCQFIT